MLFDTLGRNAFRLIHENCLVYATSWEDPRVDIKAMKIDDSSRLLVIAAAGCNVLDYAIERPELIDAVDVNYRQTALLELKLAAIAELSWDDAFRMLGEGHHPSVVELYQDSLRSSISAESQQFWDKHIEMFTGRLPFYFRTTSGWFALWFRRYIDRVLCLGPAVEDLINASSIERQREIYDSHIKARFWRPALGWALKRDAVLALSAIPPAQRRRMMQDHPDVLSYLRGKAEHIIYNQSMKENYFWRVYLTGKFSVDCCPRYLMRHHFHALKAGLLKRIRPATETVAGAITLANTPYTHFVMLDHMDWLAGRDTTQLQQEWQSIVDNASPGAKVIWRSFGDGTDFIDTTPIEASGRRTNVGDFLSYDRAAANRLQAEERVNAYASFHVATMKLGQREEAEVA